MQPIHVLVIHDGALNDNPMSLVIADYLARLGLVEFTQLRTPPESLGEHTFVLLDDPYVSRWRRQPVNRAGMPAWLRSAENCYRVGREAVASAEAIKLCAHSLRDDALFCLAAKLAPTESKPQSAVRSVFADEWHRAER